MIIFFNEFHGQTNKLQIIDQLGQLGVARIATENIISVIAVPESSIKFIQCLGDTITVNYYDGDYSCFGDEGQGAFPQVKTVKVTYDSEETALKKMKEFYWAAAKNTGAFMF